MDSKRKAQGHPGDYDDDVQLQQRPTKKLKVEQSLLIPFINECHVSDDMVDDFLSGSVVGTVVFAAVDSVVPDQTKCFEATKTLARTLIGLRRRRRLHNLDSIHTLVLNFMGFASIDALLLAAFISAFRSCGLFETFGVFKTFVLMNVTLSNVTEEASKALCDAVSGWRFLGGYLGDHVILDSVKGEKKSDHVGVSRFFESLAGKQAITVKRCGEFLIVPWGKSIFLKDLHLQECPHYLLQVFLGRALPKSKEFQIRSGLFLQQPANRHLRSLTVSKISKCPNKIAKSLLAYLKGENLHHHPTMEYFVFNFSSSTGRPPRIDAAIKAEIQEYAEKVVDPEHGNNKTIKCMSFNPIPLTDKTKYYLLENRLRNGSFNANAFGINRAWLQQLIDNKDSLSSIFYILTTQPDAFFKKPTRR